MKVKTILFASLIATLILPFSGINMVYADEKLSNEEKQRLIIKVQRLEEHIAQIDNEIVKERLIQHNNMS